MSNEIESIPALFRQEFSKMVAVISNLYGLEHIEIAEDIVSETFLQATETWEQKGIPPNPTAWLYAVAKQKTLYHFRRNKIFTGKIIPELKSDQESFIEPADVNFSTQNIKDSQLQMMFAICNPAIVSEAQIGLALRILCGFGIDEIAEAFFSCKDTINKRLFRAKKKLRDENIKLELPDEKVLSDRLDNVLHIIYLLFNEGYYSKTQNQILRKDLCLEALRLGMLLTENDSTNKPKTNALMALMCFHSSRFDARQTSDGAFILYEEQDERLWDQGMINQGINYLTHATQGREISSYHLEARIASLHCIKEDTKEKWNEILQLYDQLLMISYSQTIALNRIFALSKVKGKKEALPEAEKLGWVDNHFYFLLLGELYTGIDRNKARLSLQKSFTLAKTKTERQDIQKKIDRLK